MTFKNMAKNTDNLFLGEQHNDNSHRPRIHSH